MAFSITSSGLTLPACTTGARRAGLAPCPQGILRPLRTRQVPFYCLVNGTRLSLEENQAFQLLLVCRHAAMISTGMKRQQGVRKPGQMLTCASSGEDSVKGAVGQPSEHQGLAGSQVYALMNSQTST